MTSFHLIRRMDGLVYCFDADPVHPGLYRRADRSDLTIAWEEACGWVMRDPVSGALTGRVWDIAPTDQPRPPPPAMWVTAKGPKSYVYDLRPGAPQVLS
ncbi:hypothetical protein [uncultured Tateyamaria sp.]|uniref:hypothetical protein n=1 Tax=uncultured Tateyamaria sp. TaxID=455651 RepID=UPI0026257960|nr:hypothetical protein [uncultured Tateyamaria sp.]